MTDAQREQRRAYQRRWTAAHRDAIRAHRKRWIEKHPEYRDYHRIYQKQWRKDNPERSRAIQKRSRQKRVASQGRFLCVECGQRFSHEAAESGGFRRIGRRIGVCRDCHSRSIEIGPGTCAIWKRLGIEDPFLQWANDDAIRPEEIPHSSSTSLWMTIPETKLREVL